MAKRRKKLQKPRHILKQEIKGDNNNALKKTPTSLQTTAMHVIII